MKMRAKAMSDLAVQPMYKPLGETVVVLVRLNLLNGTLPEPRKFAVVSPSSDTIGTTSHAIYQ